MAFNGTGIFVRLYSWANDAAAGIKIRSDRMDAEDNGFATGLSNCITKDGQQTITADIPFANHKITALGNATLSTDAANAGQVRDQAFTWCGTSSGTNTYAIASGAFQIMAYAPGQTFRFIVGTTNTGAVTLNVDSQGAKTVLKNDVALVAGDWTALDVVTVVYDGTQFQDQTPKRTPVLAPNSILQTSIGSGTATANQVLLANGSGSSAFGTVVLGANSVTASNISSGASASGTVLTADGSGNSAYTPVPTQSFTAGAVGTYAMAYRKTGATADQFGGTEAGSNLEPSNAQGIGGTVTVLSGTWQCMGFASSTPASASSTTLWLRIS